MIVYDSLYNCVNVRTQVIIHELFGVSAKHDLAKAHKQQGVRDCGLFIFHCGCCGIVDFELYRDNNLKVCRLIFISYF